MSKPLVNRSIRITADPRDGKKRRKEHRVFIYINDYGEEDRISLAQARQAGNKTFVSAINKLLKGK